MRPTVPVAGGAGKPVCRSMRRAGFWCTARGVVRWHESMIKEPPGLATLSAHHIEHRVAWRYRVLTRTFSILALGAGLAPATAACSSTGDTSAAAAPTTAPTTAAAPTSAVTPTAASTAKADQACPVTTETLIAAL